MFLKVCNVHIKFFKSFSREFNIYSCLSVCIRCMQLFHFCDICNKTFQQCSQEFTIIIIIFTIIIII